MCYVLLSEHKVTSNDIELDILIHIVLHIICHVDIIYQLDIVSTGQFARFSYWPTLGANIEIILK